MTTTRVELPALADLRERYTEDVRRLKQQAGISRPNVAPGSETYIKAEAVSSATLEILARLAAVQDAVMPDSAVDDDLIRLADILRGITPAAGAGATGHVIANCTGTCTYVENLEATAPDGLRYRVTTTTVATSGTLIPMAGVDTGTRTNKPASTVLTWTSPPAASAPTALVSSGGLTNGQDADDNARLRARLLDALRHPAVSGSWAHYAKWAEESTNAIEKAFVYPARQGPATVHVAVTVPAYASAAYTRQASATLVNLAAAAVVANSPEFADITTTTVANCPYSFVVKLTLPQHKVDGGPGGGWTDASASRWPAVGGTSPYATRVYGSPTSNTIISVTTYSAPVVNAHIAFWSSTLKKFLHGRIKTATALGGAVYRLTLYNAIDSSALLADDYISPDAEKIDDYGITLASAFAGLGPGEKTSDANLLPRSLRHPLHSESWPAQFTSKDVGSLSTAHGEISHVVVVSPSLTSPLNPTVAVTAAAAPNILTLGSLAFYTA